MITPQHLLNAIWNEIRILKHLGSKVTATNKDFKLTPTQRSIEELEHYIISSFPAQVQLMVKWSWDENIYKELTSKFEWFTFDQFVSELDTCFAVISEQINTLTDAQWQEEMTIRGMNWPRTRFLNDYVLTFLWAYKMQLFLQLKASGLTELSTYNLRAGMDAPKS
jgi:hypothetical protein